MSVRNAAEQGVVVRAQEQSIAGNEQNASDQVAALQLQLAAVQLDNTPPDNTPPPPYTAGTGHVGGVAQPQFFFGDSAALFVFIRQVLAVIVLHPSRFPTENARVLFAVSFLRGPALWWFNGLASAQTPPAFMNNFRRFVTELHRQFSNVPAGRAQAAASIAREAAARRQLHNLRQTGSVSQYIAAFTRLAATTPGMSDAARSVCFHHGLRATIKDQIPQSRPLPSFRVLVRMALRIDAQEQVCRVEQQHRNQAPRQVRTQPRATTSLFTGIQRAPNAANPPTAPNVLALPAQGRTCAHQAGTLQRPAGNTGRRRSLVSIRTGNRATLWMVTHGR